MKAQGAPNPALLTEVSLAPALLPAYRKLPPPPGYVKYSELNTPLIVSGGAMFGAMYVASIVRGAQVQFKNGTGALAVPLLGPWIAIAQRDIDCSVTLEGGAGGLDDVEDSTAEASACFSREAAAIAVLTGLGIGQLVGAGLLMAGIFDRKHYYLRADLAQVKIEPLLTGSTFGLVVYGHL